MFDLYVTFMPITITMMIMIVAIFDQYRIRINTINEDYGECFRRGAATSHFNLIIIKASEDQEPNKYKNFITQALLCIFWTTKQQ